MENIGRLPSVTKRFDDLSNEKQFQFAFYCDFCGAKYRIDPIPFSVPNAPETFKDFTETQKLIWESEHDDAYERANQEALITFARCRSCGKMLCDDCALDYNNLLCPDCGKTKNTEVMEHGK